MGWLQSKPITTDEYHDCYLVGVTVSLQRSAELLIERPEGARVTIRLGGIKHLLASDFLEGNIIDDVICHVIDGPQMAQLVIDELLDFRSQYFDERWATEAQVSGNLLGLTYVAVRAIYGAYVSVVARSVAEDQVGERT